MGGGTKGGLSALRPNQQKQIEHSNDVYTVGNNINEEGRDDVKEWLNRINMDQYYEYFVNNGFDSLTLLKEINDLSYLEYIGVKVKAHQIIIIKNIEKLNWSHGV